MRPTGLAFAVGACAALLGGCATPPPAAEGWLAGRIALRVEAEPGSASRQMSASFELRGRAERGQMRLYGPLGTTLGEAQWAPGEAVLVAPQGRTRYADLDALSRDALGEPLPLQALPDWLAGRPWPGAPSQGTAEGFEQLGWRIDLQGMAEGSLVAVRARPPAVTVRVRLDPPT